MNVEQDRADFESFLSTLGLHLGAHERQMMLVAYRAGRAALQSQSVIDDEHLSIVLDVYDNAMQKAFDGRDFQNPCKPGTPEHKAWEKGSKEGKKKRDAGLPNSIALQSQDRDYEDIKDLGGQAVRWAPFSAHWSAELVRLFGPDAREGINLLEARLRDLESNDARWRYIRRKLCLIGNGNGTCEMKAINLPEAIPGWPEPGEVAEFCDLAIDHARRIEGDGE